MSAIIRSKEITLEPGRDRHNGKVERLLYIKLFQNEIHRLLNAFLNGLLLSKRSLFLYPCLKEYQQEKLSASLEKIISYLCVLCNTNGVELSDRLWQVKQYLSLKRFDSLKLSEILANLYHIFRILLREEAKKIRKTIRCPSSFDARQYMRKDAEFLRPVLALNDYIALNLQEFLYGAFIHGSMATMDYVKGASDLDTLLILKESVVLDANRLFEFEEKVVPSLKYFYQIDPLQHHGHMMITELDMKYYPQTYFPFVLFNYAVRMIGPEVMIFQERGSRLDGKELLWNMLKNKNGQKLQAAISNFYGMKYFLSIVQLIPTVFLQAHGEFCYKRDSFEKMRERYKDLNLTIIEKASAIRRNWQYRPSRLIHWASQVSLNPFFASLFYRKFHKSIPDMIVTELGAHFIDEYFELCEALSKKVQPLCPSG